MSKCLVSGASVQMDAQVECDTSTTFSHESTVDFSFLQKNPKLLEKLEKECLKVNCESSCHLCFFKITQYFYALLFILRTSNDQFNLIRIEILAEKSRLLHNRVLDIFKNCDGLHYPNPCASCISLVQLEIIESIRELYTDSFVPPLRFASTSTCMYKYITQVWEECTSNCIDSPYNTSLPVFWFS